MFCKKHNLEKEIDKIWSYDFGLRFIYVTFIYQNKKNNKTFISYIF